MFRLVGCAPEFLRCPKDKHHFSHPQRQLQIRRHAIVESDQTFGAAIQFVSNQVMPGHIIVSRGPLNQEVEQQTFVDLPLEFVWI